MNKQIRTIALNSALGQYLYDWDKEKDPEAIVKEIESVPGCYDWPEGIGVWEVFDSYSGSRLSELIETYATARVSEYLEVTDAIKQHIVTLAEEDLLDQDMNQLDLAGWVNSGFGREMEGDRITEYIVGSSHGELWVNKWGFMIEQFLTCDCRTKQIEQDCIVNIEWFDLAELGDFWGQEYLQDASHFDILDLGGHNFDGSMFTADPEFRKDVKEDKGNV